MTTNQDILKMNTVDLLNWMGTDAEKWMRGFIVHTDLANAGADFQSTVIGWFANAIGFGETAGMNSAMDEIHHAAKNLGLDLTEVYTPGHAIETAWGNAHPAFATHRELEQAMDDLNQVGWDDSLPIRDDKGIIWLVYGEERSHGGEACAWWLLHGDPEENIQEHESTYMDKTRVVQTYQPIPLTEANYPVTLLYRPREVE